MITRTTKYGILLPSGKLARYSKSHNGDAEYCGEYSYQLEEDSDYPEWLTDEPRNVAKTLFANIEWYNSDFTCPAWGKFTREQLRPAKVEIQVDLSPTEDVQLVPSLASLEVSDLSRAAAKEYINDDELPAGRFVLVLAAEAPEALQRYVGEIVGFGSFYNQRKVLAVVPVPEKFVGLELGTSRNRAVAHSAMVCQAL